MSFKEKKEEMIKIMCDNHALRNTLRKFIYYTFSKRKIAAQDMIFELLSYDTPLSQIGVVWGNNSGQKTKEEAVAQKKLVEKCYREA